MVYVLKSDMDNFATVSSLNIDETSLLSPNVDLVSITRPIKLKVNHDDRGCLPLGDFPSTGMNQPKVLSYKAYMIMKPFLDQSGVIKKVEIKGEKTPYLIFYPSIISDCMHPSSDIIRRPSGYIKAKKIIISRNKLNIDIPIFKLLDFPFGDVYINNELASVLNASELEGFLLQGVSTR